MTVRTFRCVGCGNEIQVADAEEETRCSSCGTKHGRPWNDPVVISSPMADVQEGDRREEQREQVTVQEETATIEAEAPVTITITIKVE